MKKNVFLFILISCFLYVTPLFSQVPRRMNYQAKLTDSFGVALDDPNRRVAFLLYNSATGGVPLWAETLWVNCVKGLFDVELGTIRPINLPFNTTYWLEMRIDPNDDGEMSDAEVLSPRIRLSSTAYSFRALYADTANFLTGAGSGVYIQNQYSSAQDANGWISGRFGASILWILPTAPDTFAPQVGMIRTMGTGPDYGIYSYDGTCWRQIYRKLDTLNCYGGPLRVNAGADTIVCLYTSPTLTAHPSGGWAPYDFDWSNDGTGDWDDNQSIVVPASGHATYTVQVRDITGAIASDAININAVLCFFASAVHGANSDFGYSVVQTLDGGYVVAGYTNSYGAGNGDIFVVKLDPAGGLLWATAIGGIGIDYGRAIIQTADSGFAIAGYTSGYGAGLNDLLIVKISSSGSFQWARAAGGNGNDYGYSIVQTADNGYIVAGETNSYGAGSSDFFIVKFSSSGSLDWARTIGGTNSDVCWKIAPTSDGKYVLAGNTNSFGAGNNDLIVVKLTSTGSVDWARAVGGINHDYGFSICENGLGNICAVGYTLSYGAGGEDIFIVELTSTGSFTWSRAIGGGNNERAHTIYPTSDNGYAIAGYTISYGSGSSDFAITKFTSSGSLVWARTVGGASIDEAHSIAQTIDAGYVISGNTNSFGAGTIDLFVVKTGADGSSCIGAIMSPVEYILTPSLGIISPTITMPSPTITTVSPSVASPTPTVTNCCP